MQPASAHKRFVSVFVGAFLAFCLLGASVNYLVDPYGLFGARRIAGFNERKPASTERVRVTKPYMASRVRPTVVIGGNSRPEIGLDPQSACWDKTEQPVFNMGVPGSSVFMQTRYVQHAVAQGKSRRVLFGVDFLDFLVDRNEAAGSIDWRALGKSFDGRLGPGVSLQKAEDVASGLFSLTALADSLTTVTAQHDTYAATRREDGFNPGLDYVPIIRSEGQSVLFAQKDREVRSRLHAQNLGVRYADGRRGQPLQALRQFLQWAKTEGVEAVLFVNPYHVDYLILVEMSGHWPLFEEWKRQLSDIAAEFDVPLWDFNTVDAYSTESPPPLHDRRAMLRWFWEPAHYRSELGDLMLAAMLDRRCGASVTYGFGTRLTPVSLPGELDRLRNDLRGFMQANPAAVKRLGGDG